MEAPRARYTRCSSRPSDRRRAYRPTVVEGQLASAGIDCAPATLVAKPSASMNIGPRQSGTLVTYESPPDRFKISRVRAWSIVILVLLAALPAPADIIRLKNGRTIWADQVR